MKIQEIRLFNIVTFTSIRQVMPRIFLLVSELCTPLIIYNLLSLEGHGSFCTISVGSFFFLPPVETLNRWSDKSRTLIKKGNVLEYIQGRRLQKR